MEIHHFICFDFYYSEDLGLDSMGFLWLLSGPLLTMGTAALSEYLC